MKVYGREASINFKCDRDVRFFVMVATMHGGLISKKPGEPERCELSSIFLCE